jgi:hypothetical protein
MLTKQRRGGFKKVLRERIAHRKAFNQIKEKQYGYINYGT